MTDSLPPSPRSRFLIDSILRSNEVHLISGPSQGGKTTLLLQILDDWRNSREVFGHTSTPAPYALVSCDRATTSIEDTMHRLIIDPATVPHFSIVNPPHGLFDRVESDRGPSQDDHSLSEIVAICRRRTPDLALLLIDGLPALCPGKIVDHKDVANFLRDTARLCVRQRITILATVYAPKAREGEGYIWPQDRMLGAGAWASHTGTKFILGPEGHKRTLHILPQNAAPVIIELMHDEINGRLIPFTEAVGVTDPLDKWLGTLGEDVIITTRTVVIIAASATPAISESSAKRWLSQQLELGTIHRIDRGEYRRQPAGPTIS